MADTAINKINNIIFTLNNQKYNILNLDIEHDQIDIINSLSNIQQFIPNSLIAYIKIDIVNLNWNNIILKYLILNFNCEITHIVHEGILFGFIAQLEDNTTNLKIKIIKPPIIKCKWIRNATMEDRYSPLYLNIGADYYAERNKLELENQLRNEANRIKEILELKLPIH